MSRLLSDLEWRSRLALLALAVLVLGAVLVPMLAPTDPRSIGDVLALRLLPPLVIDSAGHFHLLGTDAFGRDIFTRMMLASRVSLTVGVAGSVLSGAVGVCVGALAAWMGGAVDVPGNGSPDAEFNAYVDPDAAREVFDSGLRVDMVPLDATAHVIGHELVHGQQLDGRARPGSIATSFTPRWPAGGARSWTASRRSPRRPSVSGATCTCTIRWR